jgi:hypothetical protein
MGDAVVPSKVLVSIRNSVDFTWTIAWQGGSYTAAHRLRVDDALRKDRRIPLPPGWDVGLNALKLANHARDTSQRSLPLNVRELKCQLLGVPKRFDLPQAGHAPGACVALMDNGRRVNYVLVAHVRGDVWRCSPGAVMQNGRISLDTVWSPSDCKTKNIILDAWSGVALKRRMYSHVMTDHLQQLLREHADSFYDLVANEVWRVEQDHARKTNQAFDIKAATAGFEPNPFGWESAGQRISHTEVYFIWSWEYRGQLQHSKKAARLDKITCQDVPLPNRLFTDLALLERLLRRAERETAQTYCPCTYLGALVGPNKYEPDPSGWHDGGWKSHQQIWVEYKHVRNAESNKAHRVQVRADSWLDRGDRTPGHPLYTTSSRSLRFSLDFMDAFAQHRLEGMTFLGVCYDNPERPEIMRHLPNDIDIQNEHGATATGSHATGAFTQFSKQFQPQRSLGGALVDHVAVAS